MKIIMKQNYNLIVNRWVLSLDMKRDIDGSVRIQRGILFQRVGARTAKDLFP